MDEKTVEVTQQTKAAKLKELKDSGAEIVRVDIKNNKTFIVVKHLTLEERVEALEKEVKQLKKQGGKA